jgi:hypothetical protein
VSMISLKSVQNHLLTTKSLLNHVGNAHGLPVGVMTYKIRMSSGKTL